MKTGKRETVAGIVGLLLACFFSFHAVQPPSTQAAVLIRAVTPDTEPVFVGEPFVITVTLTNTGAAGSFNISLEQDTLTSMSVNLDPPVDPPSNVYTARSIGAGVTTLFRFNVVADLAGKFLLYARVSGGGGADVIRPTEMTVLLPTFSVVVTSVVPFKLPVNIGEVTSATVTVRNPGQTAGAFDIILEVDSPGPLQVLTPPYMGEAIPAGESASFAFEYKVTGFGPGNLYGRARRSATPDWESSVTGVGGNTDTTAPEVVSIAFSGNPVNAGADFFVAVLVKNPGKVSGLFDIGVEKDLSLPLATLPPPKQNEVIAAEGFRNFIFTLKGTAPGKGFVYGRARRAGGTGWQDSASGELTIQGASGTPEVRVAALDPLASEVGPDPGVLRISRTNAFGPLDVFFSMGGAAANGTDYELVSNPVTITSGSLYVDVAVMPRADSITEGEEQATLILWDNPSYTLGFPSSASVVIREVYVPPPSAAIRALITRFYNEALGRDPEPGAVDAWEQGYYNYALTFHIDVRFIGREMGRLFFESEENLARNRSDVEFIADCYSAFLGREPSLEELNAWTGGVWNRPQAVSLIADSLEFANVMEQISPGQTGDPTRNFVTTMYIGILDRLVDQNGLLWWADSFATSTNKRATARTMALTLFGSAEYAAKNASNETLVTNLYRAFLGRYPSTTEIAYWALELESGRRTQAQLLDFFVNSEEFTQILAEYFGS